MSVRDPLTYTMGGCITLNNGDLQSDIEPERERETGTHWLKNEGDGEIKVVG